MTTPIKGILFDKDGTLFDFHTTWGAWAATFFLDLAGGDRQRAGEMARPLGYDFQTCAFQKDSVIIAGTPEEVTAAIIDAVPNWAEADIIRHINKVSSDVPQAEPVPLRPLLKGLRARGIRLGVATNDAQAPTQVHLAKAGIAELFDFVAGFDSGFGAKPDIGMQRAFCAAVGLRPAECLMVGDSEHDLISGRRAGMAVAAVLTGMADHDDLAPLADVVLDNIGGIPDWLGLSL